MSPRQNRASLRDKAIYLSIGFLAGLIFFMATSSRAYSRPDTPDRAGQLQPPEVQQKLDESRSNSVSLLEHTKASALPPPYTTCEAQIQASYDYKKEPLMELAESPSVSPVTGALDLRTFECTAREVGTVKVVEHHYEYIYAKYLSTIRDQPLRLLAIGLGCNMRYGAGHSLELWKRYLPKASISFIELNATCAEPFRQQLEATGGRLYIGGQDNKEVMRQVIEDSSTLGPFDVISDDGALLPHIQKRSLEGLWPALRPGGLYVVEDIFKSFESKWEQRSDTFLPRIVDLIHKLQCRSVWRTGFKKFSDRWREVCANATEFERSVLSVECIWEACMLIKHLR